MTANPCPNHVWNHTSGCACTPNGSITAEVADVDLVATPVASGPPTPDFVRDPNASIPGGAATAAANILRRALEAGDDPERAYSSYDHAVRQIDLLTPGVTQARMTFDDAVEEHQWRIDNGSSIHYVTESRRARTETYLALVKARDSVGYRAPRASTVHSEMGSEPREMSHA